MKSTDEAVEKLSNTQFDAIISDMGRPPDQRAGYTLLEIVRSSGNRTPYFIYAGSRAPEHVAESFRRGAQGTTNNPAELIAMVIGSLRTEVAEGHPNGERAERHVVTPSVAAARAVDEHETGIASMEPGAIFISYAHEDQAAARRLRDFLEEEAGIDVWLDIGRFNRGDNCDFRLRRNIKNCSYFMPLISAATTRQQEGYFLREWALAADRAMDFPRSVPFIIPVVIDETRESAGAIPEAFPRLHSVWLPGGSGTEEFRRRMIALVRDYRRRVRDPKIQMRGIDPSMSTSPPGAGTSVSRRDKVFISYSHRDHKAFEELKTMLAPVMRSGKVDAWDDTKIAPGAKWKDEIRSALGAAKVAVLLVSQNFLASDFIAKRELPPLLKAAQDEGVAVFWVYLSSCLYKETEIAEYQAAHDVAKPLGQLTKPMRQQALRKICEKLVQAVQAS